MVDRLVVVMLLSTALSTLLHLRSTTLQVHLDTNLRHLYHLRDTMPVDQAQGQDLQATVLHQDLQAATCMCLHHLCTTLPIKASISHLHRFDQLTAVVQIRMTSRARRWMVTLLIPKRINSEVL